MRRRALRIFVFLLLGAVVNVAVVWGCGWRSAPASAAVAWSGWFGEKTILDDFVVVLMRHRGFGVERVRLDGVENLDDSYHARAFGPARPWWIPESYLDDPAGYRICLAQGWPVLALWCESTGPTAASTQGGVFLHQGNYGRAVRKRDIEHVLALRPLWRGFAINTLFYAGILWLLFAAPFALRRLRRGLRIRRGLCPTCAYDLRGRPNDAPACPECGAAVSLVRPDG